MQALTSTLQATSASLTAAASGVLPPEDSLTNPLASGAEDSTSAKTDSPAGYSSLSSSSTSADAPEARVLGVGPDSEYWVVHNGEAIKAGKETGEKWRVRIEFNIVLVCSLSKISLFNRLIDLI